MRHVRERPIPHRAIKTQLDYDCRYVIDHATPGLSFLGLGTQPPEPSWGSMLNAACTYMEPNTWMAIAPSFAIAIVVLGLNFLGDGLRDVLDPRLRVR